MIEPLWVDKYRPKKIDRLYHEEITETLKDLAKTNDFPHLIFYGPEGAGKKTRVINFIQEVYGASSMVLNEQMKEFKIEQPNKTIEYCLISSHYHMEITPSDNEFDDRHIIQKVVKDIASTTEINQKAHKKFKILVINEADRLSKEAQGSLRRTMEKYMGACRMILVCQHVHKLIAPIRSRCLNIRVPAPSIQTIINVLRDVARSEYMEVTDGVLEQIAKLSGRNLRDAICQLQCYRARQKVDLNGMHPYKPAIKQICKLIIAEQTATQLEIIRDQFYDLLGNCVEPSIIMKLLFQELVASKRIKKQALKELTNKGEEVQMTMCQGSKPIVHLECFAANAMEAVLMTIESM